MPEAFPRFGGYKGKVAVGLVRGGNQLVDVLAEQAVNWKSEEVVPQIQFVCRVKEDTEVLEGDEIRLLVTQDGVNYEKLAGRPGVTDAIPAVKYDLPLLKTNHAGGRAGCGSAFGRNGLVA